MLFDAIFTLNQDLLLESVYLMPVGIGYGLSLVQGTRWDIGVLPGVEAIPDPLVVGGYNVLRTHWRPVASPRSTVIESRQQPYYKLHGSTNWHDPSGRHLLVMGGNKPTAMQRHPILTWYAEKFAEAVSKPNARLMIIGYGFRDDHINRMICEGWEKGGRAHSRCLSSTRTAAKFSRRSIQASETKYFSSSVKRTASSRGLSSG